MPPPLQKKPRRVNSNLLITDWLVESLLKDNVRNSLIEIKAFNKVPRVMKILKFLRVTRCCILAVLADANHSILAEFHHSVIYNTEKDERRRFSKDLLNADILVKKCSLKFMTGLQVLRDFTINFKEGSKSGSDFRFSTEYAVIIVEDMRIHNRDQIIEQNTIPFVYHHPRYKEVYCSRHKRNQMLNKYLSIDLSNQVANEPQDEMSQEFPVHESPFENALKF